MGRKKYEELRLSVICFEVADIITMSPNDYDNTGDWVDGW